MAPTEELRSTEGTAESPGVLDPRGDFSLQASLTRPEHSPENPHMHTQQNKSGKGKKQITPKTPLPSTNGLCSYIVLVVGEVSWGARASEMLHSGINSSFLCHMQSQVHRPQKPSDGQAATPCTLRCTRGVGGWRISATTQNATPGGNPGGSHLLSNCPAG